MVQNLYDYWKLKNSCVGHAKAFCKWKFSMLGSQPCSYKKFIWALESLYFWVCWFSDVNWEYPRCFSVEVIGHKIWMLYKLERLVGPKPNVISKSQSLVHGGIAQKVTKIGSLGVFGNTLIHGQSFASVLDRKKNDVWHLWNLSSFIFFDYEA